MRNSAIDVTSNLGRLRLRMMQTPDEWSRPADVADELGLERQVVSNYLARMFRRGDLDRREGKARDRVSGPKTEYRLKSGRNLLAPRQKEN